jgi:hypothetical protein
MRAGRALIGVCVVLVVTLPGVSFVWDEWARDAWSEPANVGGRTDSGDVRVRVTLDDGRQVELKRGDPDLVERHRSAEGGSWSAPRVIYRSKERKCGPIKLAARGGTLAAFAPYGDGCVDGDPPAYGIAAVATADDLADWDIDITEDFDGWGRVRFSPDGHHVRFEEPVVGEPHPSALDWRSYWGFSDPYFAQ